MAISETRKIGQELKGQLSGHRNGHEAISLSIPLTISLEDEAARNRNLVGGKAFGLAELKGISEIAKKVPDGFVATALVYDQILEQNPQIRAEVESLDNMSVQWLKAKLTENNEEAGVLEGQITAEGEMIKKMIKDAKLSVLVENEIGMAYDELCRKIGEENMRVAVRSSGVQEDGADKSFAGQNETKLNIRGKEQIVEAARICWASQFEGRAVSYRNNERLRISGQILKDKPEDIDMAIAGSEEFSHGESRLSLVIEKMINSSVSGVALSIDPTTGAPRIIIELNNGIGESVVGGEVTPDSFEVDPRTLEIVSRRLGAKGVKTSYSKEGTESVEVSKDDSNKFAVADAKVIEIARDVILVKERLGKEVDMEFALGETGEIHWVQERAETVGSKKDPHIVEMREYGIPEEVAENADVILSGGIMGSPGAASGTKLIANTVEEARAILESEENKGKDMILIADMTTPDWVPIMRRVKGIITRHGGRTCHAAIVSREMGVPCLVGTEEEIEALKNDGIQEITLDVRGMKVYKGILPLKETGEDIDVREILNNPTDTVIGINIAMPDEAKRLYPLALLKDHFEVDLVRQEVLLADKVGVHVNALVDFDKGNIDPASDLYRQIKEKIRGSSSGEDYFITTMAEGLASIAGNFPDSPITVRTTDFKTNEYQNLIGGDKYEAKEANPMMGWRGLVRFLHPANREAFKWELRAIKKARDMGNKNIKIMFPMVRDPMELTGSPEEMDKEYGKGFRSAYDIMREVGLERGRDGLKVGIMVEDETNVERVDDYIDAGIDFGSIGSNDLTQLVLAADRDNGKLQKIARYSEKNPAVLNKMTRVIGRYNERGIRISICGDAPSSSPTIVKILVEKGINSIGVTPNSWLPAYRLTREVEQSRKSQVAPTTIFTAN